MDYSKISPSLAAAFDDYRRDGRRGLASHQALGLVSAGPAAKPARVIVFLQVARRRSLDHLAELGVEVNDGEGPIRTGIVPLETLGEVSDDRAVVRIVPAHRLEPVIDVASEKVHVPKLRKSAGLSGKGVVIGIVDTGIEPTHPSFAGRILRIWDQNLNGPGVPEGGYGVELEGDQLLLSRDTNGHGTHVAGISAGDHHTFGGIAPEAALVIVKSDLWTAHIADGVRYIFRVAAELGRPAVVNLSLGGHEDAHDGTDPLSEILDAEVGPGRIVCCAAGNDGNANIHSQAQLRPNSTLSVPMAVPPAAGGQPSAIAGLNGWYAAGDTVGVAMVSPAGTQTPFQPVITDGSPTRTYALADGTVTITTPGPDPSNGDVNFVVRFQAAPVEPGPFPPRAGAWKLRLRSRKVSDGRVDVWSVSRFAAQFTGSLARDSMKVGAPGAATRAITVGSYTTRADWVDLLGNPHGGGLELDDISDFSSEGPRRDGIEKPDIVAPGAMIVSSLSVHSPVEPDFLIDDLHTIMAGTSMASPFVAGLVALLLERTPTLEPEAVRKTLRAHSTVPGSKPGVYDPKWGYGLIDADGLASRRKTAVRRTGRKG